MKIYEAPEFWEGGPATLVNENTLNKIYIKEDGTLHIPEQGMPLDLLSDNKWKLKYHKEYDSEKLIRALADIDPEVYDLLRSEWNDWQIDLSRKVLYAVARVFNFKIKELERIS